jgi:hypothetical protein
MKQINSNAVRAEILAAIANQQLETTKRPSKWVYIISAGIILLTGVSAIL